MRELSEMPEVTRERALSRLRLLEPHLEQGQSLLTVAKEAGVPFRTAGRWLALYREHGLAGLSRKARADRGAHRVVSPEMRRLIVGLALELPRLPCRSIHRQVRQFAEAKGEPLPSYWLIRAIVRQLTPGLLSLAHDGPKVYSENFDLVHRREASRPNAIWQADHAQLDIMVLRDDGSVAKPWLTIVIDDYSRAVAGYYLAFEPPSVLRTALALRQGIWRKEDPHWPVCGIPGVLYTDHGVDFTSQHIRQAAADLKMQLIFATQPAARPRPHRAFLPHRQRDVPLRPGWLSAPLSTQADPHSGEPGEAVPNVSAGGLPPPAEPGRR